jgi:hypothetical protein
VDFKETAQAVAFCCAGEGVREEKIEKVSTTKMHDVLNERDQQNQGDRGTITRFISQHKP